MRRMLLTLATAVLAAVASVAADVNGGPSTQPWPLATAVVAAVAGAVSLATAAIGVGLVRDLAWARVGAKIARFADSRHQCWRMCRSGAFPVMFWSETKVARFDTSHRQCWRL